MSVTKMMPTFIITEKTPMMATFCSIPIYFLRMKNRLKSMAPIVIKILIKLPELFRIYLDRSIPHLLDHPTSTAPNWMCPIAAAAWILQK